jgi:DNA-directed RNA polymerase specialized sigma24 family protein
VIARYCEDYTFREIADALGIDVVTARRHFNIGIRELRHRLRKAA